MTEEPAALNVERSQAQRSASSGDGLFIGGFLKVAGEMTQQSGVPLG